MKMKIKTIESIFNEFKKEFIVVEYHEESDVMLLTNQRYCMIPQRHIEKIYRYCKKHKLNFYVATHPVHNWMCFIIYK